MYANIHIQIPVDVLLSQELQGLALMRPGRVWKNLRSVNDLPKILGKINIKQKYWATFNKGHPLPSCAPGADILSRRQCCVRQEGHRLKRARAGSSAHRPKSLRLLVESVQ